MGKIPAWVWGAGAAVAVAAWIRSGSSKSKPKAKATSRRSPRVIVTPATAEDVPGGSVPVPPNAAQLCAEANWLEDPIRVSYQGRTIQRPPIYSQLPASWEPGQWTQAERGFLEGMKAVIQELGIQSSGVTRSTYRKLAQSKLDAARTALDKLGSIVGEARTPASVASLYNSLGQAVFCAETAIAADQVMDLAGVSPVA